MDQPADDDLPDDFKVGVAVADCDASIRLAFIRKVYTILFIQLLCTGAVGLGMNTGPAVEFTRANPWVIWVPMLGSFVSLIGTYIKRHDFPLNMVMLGLFTLFEAVMVGALTSFYESKIVSFLFIC
jgi:FtsH-binding integral membrane protein